ncbi:MAG: hypothetical protein ACYTHK_18200 [Planctomycetota bacterium]|jgi:ribosomal protein L7/L12
MEFSTAIVLILIAFGVGYLAGKKAITGSELPPPAAPDQAALESVRPILRSAGKIEAIKAYREKTGCGLRDAKFAVDTLDSDAT